MQPQQWFFAALPVVLIAIGGAWTLAGEDVGTAAESPAPNTVPQAAPTDAPAMIPEQAQVSVQATGTVEQPQVPEQNRIPEQADVPEQVQISEQTQIPEQAQIPEQVQVPEPAPAPEQATAELEQVQGKDHALFLLPPAPPPSLQTLVDERRDLLRERREAMFDAYSGRHLYMPPWWEAYDEGVERYRDATRLRHRQRRDYSRRQHDNWMNAMCPWSKPSRDLSAQRNYLRQMEQLDRQAYRDALMYRGPFGFTGPGGW